MIYNSQMQTQRRSSNGETKQAYLQHWQTNNKCHNTKEKKYHFIIDAGHFRIQSRSNEISFEMVI